MAPFRVVAIITTHNEGDIIAAVLADLIEQGVGVYLIDHSSSDDTIAEATPFLGHGLLHIEQFPEESGAGGGERDRFSLSLQMKRKQEVAAQLEASWFIHCDADELRESPWPHLTLRDAIALVDRLGYNAIDFAVFNFRPINDGYRRGDDLRAAFTHYEPPGHYDQVQIKCWKNLGGAVELARTGGHEAEFEGRKVFPIRFLLRHYPIRTQSQGERKVFRERIPRFAVEERMREWHIQYDGLAPGYSFIRDSRELLAFDLEAARVQLALHHRGLEAVRDERDRREREIERLQRELAASVQEGAKLRQQLSDAEAGLEELYRSRSWRWSALARRAWRSFGRP
jgi:hypothetical protein